MQPPISYQLREQQLWLSADRTIFWEEEKALIVSDLHFGKTGHFRKWGIAVPQGVYRNDLQRLVAQILYFQPKQVIVVGDLFHSHENKELELFRRWRENFPDLTIRLIKGNHDILHDSWYRQTDIDVTEELLSLNNLFGFIHDCTPEQFSRNSHHYYFSGHLHPGVRISGMARQSLCFPCFYFTREFCVLPAFSEFTGLAMIRPVADENVFAIVENKVMQLQ